MWEYYDILDDKRVRCRLCTVVMSRNKERHMKTKHPVTFKQVQKRRQQTEVEGAEELMSSNELLRDNGRDRKSSTLWTYFDDLGNNAVRCKLCDSKMSKNMARHLQTKHTKAYMQYQKQKKVKEMETPKVVLNEDGSQTADSGNKPSLNTCLRQLCSGLDNGYYECNLCKKQLKLPQGSLWNLRRHIEKKHPTRFKELIDLCKESIAFNKRETGETKHTPKARTGWIKKYCEAVEEGVYRCNLCGEQLRMREGLYGNMKRHVKSLHPRAYQEELILSEANADNVNDDVVGYIVEYVDTDDIEKNKSNIDDLLDNSSQDSDSKEVDSDQHTEYLVEESVQELESNVEVIESSDDEPLVVRMDKQSVQKLVIEVLSLKDPDLENKIKMLCETPVKGKRYNLDCSWNFFKPITGSRLYVCLFCNQDLTISPGSCANLKRHLAMKHKKQYAIINKYDINKKLNQNRYLDADMPSLDPETEVETDSETEPEAATELVTETETEVINFEVIDKKFTCKLCDTVMAYDGDDSTVIKHIQEHHPDQEIVATETTKDENVKKGNIWTYFDKLKYNKLRCRLCTTIITSNMGSHLRMRHPVTFLKYRKIRSEIRVAKTKEQGKGRELLRSQCRDRRRNPLWAFFDDLGNRTVRCQICDLKIRGNSMSRHLRTKHSKTYLEYEEQRLASNPDDNEEEREEYDVSAVSKRRLSLNTYLRQMCTSVGDGCYQCNICKRELRLDVYKLWSLRRHIAKKHPSRYDELMRQFKENISVNTRCTIKEIKERHAKQQAWIRQYYEEGDNGEYKCNFCALKLQMSLGYLANLKRHIRDLHPKAYKKNLKIITKEKNESNNASEEEIDYLVEYVDMNNLKNTESNAGVLPEDSSEETDFNKLKSETNPETLEDHELVSEELQSYSGDSESIKKKSELVREIFDSAEDIDLTSIDDPDLENKIKTLCETHVKGKRSSCIWNFYKVVLQNRMYACLFCNRNIALGRGGIGNLRRHISLKHKKQYKIILKYDTFKKPSMDEKQSDIPSKAKPDGRVSYEIKEGVFMCRLCDIVLPYKDDKDVVLKHIKLFSACRFITTNRGHMLLMFHGYTFAMNTRSKRLYYCSSKNKGCKARLKIDKYNRLILGDEFVHNHYPPTYKLLQSGIYMKVY
ncbi:hypothetical protein K1T71_006539 [Dendrolimus kikuchii]|uniref:Uncharacterized protein n=1 Tax=Dendrolimus kikuchii TaxID=765133 RepID=A0ACC1D1F0_9NEOP|nr:hypothetical protein K1T71_006539 [Dendrolimus kikuchii]